MDIKALAERIFANKIKNHFPINDSKHELELLGGEVLEALEALGDNKALGKELADIAIFLIAVAKIEEIDLEQEIVDKINYNETRKYKPGTFRLEVEDA